MSTQRTIAMSRPRPPAVPRRALAFCVALTALALAVPASALGAVNVERAELKSGQLRVEGSGAASSSTVTVASDSVATGRADGSGEFRVETTGFISSTCVVTVSDGVSSDEAALEGCAPSIVEPAPTPEPTLTPEPTPTPEPNPTPEPDSTTTFRIVDDVLPNGNVGTAYSGSLFSRGASGDRPVEYRIVSGQLPAGLSMTRSFGVASALITGTPTTVGTSSFTVEARDGSGQTARKSLTIRIDPPLPLVITNLSDILAPGTVGVSYQIQLFADGGVRPYSWSIVAGQLPPGLSLSRSGLISGTPTTLGMFAFTARSTDQAGVQATRQFSVAVTR
jgi:Putative Ig domain